MIRRIPDELNLTLVYNNLKPKAPIGEAEVTSITNSIGDFKYLQFSLKQDIFKEGKTVEHPAYNKIQLEQLVLLNDYGYYVIKDIQQIEDANEIKKVVSCASIESRLAKKMLELPHKVIQLQKNSLDPEEGILDIFEQETGWKVKYLDENAQYDNLVNGQALKYRNIEVSETWWNFMSVTIQEAFDVVVYFDHLDKTVSIFDRATFGQDTQLILSRRNYLDNLNKNCDNTDLVTRMYVTGEEGVAINSVNPLGTNYVEDFSYFANEEYMSKELIDALDIYYPLLEELQERWYEQHEILASLQKEELENDEALTNKTTELRAKKNLQVEALKDDKGNPDNEMLTELKKVIDGLELEIEEIKANAERLTEEITKQEAVLLEISLSMTKEKIEKDGERVFTDETLDELDCFIFEGNWDNTYYTTDLALFYAAKEQIKKVCKPAFSFSVGLNQLAIDVFQLKAIRSELYELGDFVIVETNEDLRRSGEAKYEKVRIIGYSYNPQTDSTDLTLSNEEFSLTQEGKMSSALNSAVNVSQKFEANKLTLEQARLNANWIEDYYRNSLDVAKKNILSAYGNNEISITENGIVLRDIRNLDDIVLLSVGGILLSKDGLATVKTAITADGVTAQELIGKIILGEELYITSPEGELSIVGNLLTIKDELQKTKVKLGEYEKGSFGLQILDEDGQVAIDSRGLIQRERATFCDNLDENNPYTFMLPLDAGLSEIREAYVWLDPKRFRGYTKSVESADDTQFTSGSSSKTTSGSSSILTSKVNINTSSSGGYATGSYGTGWASGFGGFGHLSSLNSGAHNHITLVRGDSELIPVYGGNGGHVLCRKYIGAKTATSGLGYIYFVAKDTDPQFIYTGVNEQATLSISEEEEEIASAFKEATGYDFNKFANYFESKFALLKEDEGVARCAMAMDSEFEGLSDEEINEIYEAGVLFAMARATTGHEHSDFNHYHANQHAHNMEHTHNMEHNHEITVRGHSHPIVFGIYEDPEFTAPTVSLWGRIDNEQWELIYDNISVRHKYDLKPYLDKVNVKDKDNLVEFQIRAKTRARVEGAFLMKCMTRY